MTLKTLSLWIKVVLSIDKFLSRLLFDPREKLFLAPLTIESANQSNGRWIGNSHFNHNLYWTRTLSFKRFWLRNSIQNNNCSQTNYVDLLHEILSMLLIFKDITCFLSQIMTKLHYLNYFSKVSLKRIEQTKHAEPKSSQLLCYNLVSTEMEISFISPGRNIWIFVTRKANYNCISLFGTSPPLWHGAVWEQMHVK